MCSLGRERCRSQGPSMESRHTRSPSHLVRVPLLAQCRCHLEGDAGRAGGGEAVTQLRSHPGDHPGSVWVQISQKTKSSLRIEEIFELGGSRVGRVSQRPPGTSLLFIPDGEPSPLEKAPVRSEITEEALNACNLTE